MEVLMGKCYLSTPFLTRSWKKKKKGKRKSGNKWIMKSEIIYDILLWVWKKDPCGINGEVTEQPSHDGWLKRMLFLTFVHKYPTVPPYTLCPSLRLIPCGNHLLPRLHPSPYLSFLLNNAFSPLKRYFLPPAHLLYGEWIKFK